MYKSWFSKDYRVSLIYLLRMLNIADCNLFCILCGIRLLEIILIQFVGILLVLRSKVDENNNKWKKEKKDFWSNILRENTISERSEV